MKIPNLRIEIEEGEDSQLKGPEVTEKNLLKPKERDGHECRKSLPNRLEQKRKSPPIT